MSDAGPDLQRLLDTAPDDHEAARELVEVVRAVLRKPEQRVGTAFKLTRRGGEPDWRSAARNERDGAILQLAEMLPPDRSFEQKARRIIALADRYRAIPTDGGGDLMRQALCRIAEAGVPMPGTRQIKRILARSCSHLAGGVRYR